MDEKKLREQIVNLKRAIDKKEPPSTIVTMLKALEREDAPTEDVLRVSLMCAGMDPPSKDQSLVTVTVPFLVGFKCCANLSLCRNACEAAICPPPPTISSCIVRDEPPTLLWCI